MFIVCSVLSVMNGCIIYEAQLIVLAIFTSRKNIENEAKIVRGDFSAEQKRVLFLSCD